MIKTKNITHTNCAKKSQINLKEQKQWKTHTKFQESNAMFLTAFITLKMMLVKQVRLRLALAAPVIAQPIPVATPLRQKTNSAI